MLNDQVRGFGEAAMANEHSGQRNGVGASVLRKEDDRHLRGRGQFVADIALRGTQEVVFLRSPHAHAVINSVSVPPALRGRVFTAGDLPRIKPIQVVTQAAGARSPPWPPLATDKVRYVGEAIAACVAPTHAEAEDLAASIEVDYRPLVAVVDAPASRASSPALVHEYFGDNLFHERTIAGGDIDAAMRAADITVSPVHRWSAAACSPVATTVSTRSSCMRRPRRRTRCAWRSARSLGSRNAASASWRPMSAAALGPRPGYIRKRSSSPHWRWNSTTRCAGSRPAMNIS
jgi:hypothetical protein